jgi:Ca-activated chloride channel family protein
VTLLWSELIVALLLVPLVLLVYLWARRRRRPQAARYSSLSLLAAAGPQRRRWRRHLPFVLLLAGIASVSFALTRPVAVLAVPSNQTTILLAMDVSGSMCADDIPPTRLRAAQEAASAFIRDQPAGTQIGIVGFSSFAAILQQPTEDRDDLLSAVDSLLVGRGTAIGSGILTAIDAIAGTDGNVAPAEIDGRPGVAPTPVLPGAYAPAIIVLLTDGANNAGIEPLDAAQQAADRGLRVFTIGFGTDKGGRIGEDCRRRLIGNEPGAGNFGGGFGGGQGGFGGGGGFRRAIDEDTLRAVADLTGGTYSPAGSAAELQAVFEGLPTTIVTKSETVELSVVFVAVGAAFAAVGLLLSRLWRPLP